MSPANTQQFAFTYDEEVRAKIETHIMTERLTRKQASELIGLSSETRLSKYLTLNKPNAIPEPDMPHVENAIKHFLRHQDRRAAMMGTLFETSVSKVIDSTFKLIRKSGDFGFIHGPAGCGKTCGGLFYQAQNPNVMFFTADKEHCSSPAMRRMVFEELRWLKNSRGQIWHRRIRPGDWIYDILRTSERFAIIDNAQRLTLGALEWWADLNDATGTPVVFMGNPDALTVMQRSDQVSSRIGIVTPVDIKQDNKLIAEGLVKLFAPEGNGTLVEAIEDKVLEPGRARRAKKFLRLASCIHDGLPEKGRSWERAAELAESKLLRPNPMALKK